MKHLRKSRRGSTIVMVAILLVAFLGVGAFGADIGRFYVVTGELQTAADAAALAGALKLMGTSGGTPGPTVKAEVQDFVRNTNHADNLALAVSLDSVRMAFYTPRDSATNTPSSVDFAVGLRRPNAVYVRLAAAPTGVFSQLLGRTGSLDLSRTAVAWIANINSNCVRGMAMPYRALYNQVAAVDVLSPTAVPNLDPIEFSQYEAKDDTARMFILPPDRAGAGPNDPLTPTQVSYSDGRWRGIEYHGNNGKNAYMGGIAGCTRTGLDASDVKALSSVNVPKWTYDALTTTVAPNPAPVCVIKAGDAGCYTSLGATKPGVVINVDWVDDPDANGSFGPKYRYVGKFTLVCVSDGSLPCNNSKTGAPKVYPEGTIIGFMKSLSSTKITPNDIISNTPSNVQRIILVR
jgi:Flp pilus assembly protein TadG